MKLTPGGDALVDHLCEVIVLQGGGHSFLVCQLLVYRQLGGVGAGRYFHGDLKARWQRAEQLHPDGEANQSGHRAMGNRRGEADVHGILAIVYPD